MRKCGTDQPRILHWTKALHRTASPLLHITSNRSSLLDHDFSNRPYLKQTTSHYPTATPIKNIFFDSVKYQKEDKINLLHRHFLLRIAPPHLLQITMSLPLNHISSTGLNFHQYQIRRTGWYLQWITPTQHLITPIKHLL